MATIAGSHFDATSPVAPVSIGFDSGGSPPAPSGGAFNLEIFVGSDANAPAVAPSYQGLAVLSPSGSELDLISGAYAIVDNGTGDDTIDANGANETITGGGGSDTLVLNGNGNIANSGTGNDTVGLSGNNDMANINGTDTVNVSGGTLDTVTAGAGNGLINLAGSASDFTLVDGPNIYSDTVVGFNQAAGDTIHLTGSDTASYAVAHSQPANGGQDTMIMLNDGSTILLKGITSINGSFFS
jgi:hypothetical protein